MEIGAAIFFTDYSMAPTELAVALEERGFDSLWVAEHSHIPAARGHDPRRRPRLRVTRPIITGKYPRQLVLCLNGDFPRDS